ncbi:Glycosyl hydrolases family 28 [Pustulibacterium marinum]|uniref:Glycosyl hydrolases family 28 n=1 Tax=Pustulibacterium marinum TaxID=1224947 RepID=A0A1I7IAY6_9FLAO|nr:glycosyl hydrolase family 28 protein [Pustulibacterium marinum]SFU69990.1 Glycosyl hydrolases family 28 [Pustulibacterium marinum]
MKTILTFVCILCSLVINAQDIFPDGTPISNWFKDYKVVELEDLGKKYVITDHEVVNDSTLLQTEKIQAVIDKAAANGGGVIIIPKGTFLSGAIFFKPKTHLYLEEGAVLKGSDDISNFPVMMTRIEGESVKYFPALVNADHVDGFTLTGKGLLNGNGLRYWKAFWLRREFNPKCTNKDEMRPRLLYVSNSDNVQIANVSFKDSPFWTTHYYKCNNLKLLNLHITSPREPVKSPSTDAVDLDVCSNVLIKNCYMSVNDDAVALKGGKGPFADKNEENGENRNILIEDNTYGFCHSALTCGSESIHNYNVLFRRSTVSEASRLLNLKMRPDTPQHYEYITLQDIKGDVAKIMEIKPWTQFFNLKGEKDIKKSVANNITFENVEIDCKMDFNIKKSDQYQLKDFSFIHVKITADESHVEDLKNIQHVSKKDFVLN